MKKGYIILVGYFVATIGTSICFAGDLDGQAIKVSDGDTLKMLTVGGTIETIRLSGIDAPEKKQTFGLAAKKSLSDLVQGKRISVDWNKRDRYGRIVGKVLLNKLDVNLVQIRRGLAWHYKKYTKEQDVDDISKYAQGEYLAQKSGIGLWSENNPTPPWEWRQAQKSKRKTN